MSNRLVLPPIRKGSMPAKVLNKLRARLRLDHWKPMNADGSINAEYAEHFADWYGVKAYYAPGQRQYQPPFALLGKYPGRRMVIFGNGPSLKKFNFTLLRDALTIGTNTSSEFFHADYVLISSPFALIRAQRYLDLQRSQVLAAASLWNGRTRRDLWANYADRVVPVESTEGAWSIADGRLVGSGHNVGQLAVDVAILMGATSILLVGCDGYKDRTLEQMYAGEYNNVYRSVLARNRPSIPKHEQMLWARDDKVHEEFFQKQVYCREHGVRFAVWGEDCSYHKLNKITNDVIGEWV